MPPDKVKTKVLLDAATRRLGSAKVEEWMLTRQIDYHDAEATRIRKLRQAERGKIDRAKAAIERYDAVLNEADEEL